MKPIDLRDPAAVLEWIARVEAVADDAIGAAEDQLRPVNRRELGPRQARRLIREAKVSLGSLFAIARGALPSDPSK